MNEAVFAARISSIERFTGESPIIFVQKYKKLLENYLNVSELIGILKGDSAYAELNQLLYKAIDIAGAETDKGIGKMNKGKNLASVFSRLSLTDEQLVRSKFYRYELKSLTPQDAFPQEPFEDADNQQLINGFYKEMDYLQNSAKPKNYHAFIICFDRISRKYMWCITASDYEGEDISLYDFMRVTEAIMVCLVRSDDKEKPFTLVMGDFSGIQKYIFAIASPNNEGVAKRLRARSFYVDIVNTVFSHYVADCFEVEQTNILLQSGGKFYCIVPTFNTTSERLNDIRNEFDQYLFEKFHGFVSVNLAWLICSGDDIKNYSDSIVKLNELLSEEKATPFEQILKCDGKWASGQFVLYHDLKDKQICKICGMELADKEKSSCDMCDMQLEIGKQLPHTKYILFTKTEGGKAFPIFKNYGIQFLSDIQEGSEAALKEAYLIEALNDAKINQIREYPCIIKYMSNYIPVDNYEPKTFSEIAESGQGINKLAVLKADVDVLGFLFSQGLRAKERHFGTISRVNTMSRMLEVFFCGYVEWLLKSKPAYHDVYSVFSGGDDLFLLGPWDVMLDLSAEVQRDFKEFTAQNVSVTMSAAVSVFSAKEHIAYMAEYTESQLELAKNDGTKQTNPQKTSGRDALCIMGELISWGDYKEQLGYANQFVQMIQENKISIGALRRIAQYSGMYRKYWLNGDTWQLMFVPMYYYDSKRNYLSSELRGFMERYLASMGSAQDRSQVNKNLYFAETMIKIALNKTRKERN